MTSHQVTFTAIGTQWWVEIFDPISHEELETTKRRLELLSSEFNQRYSRFITNSQISTLNQNRVFHNPSKEFLDLLTLGKRLYQETHTTFNILTGHIQEAHGYDKDYRFTPNNHIKPVICNPLTDLEVTEEKVLLHCGAVDIGGFGKGWLIDTLKDNLLENNITHFLINGGGDMYATTDAQNEAITIYLEHPTKTGTYLMETTLKNQGFAASSPFKRTWNHGDTNYSHIVSFEESPQMASFVKAPTATLADALSTASLLLTEDQLLTLASQEGVTFARYTPATSELWQTAQFA